MPSPTGYAGWVLPAEDQDPWYATYQALVLAQDVTVRSLEILAPTRATVVVTAGPPLAQVALNAPGATPPPWAAPTVPLSFRIVGSGGQAYFVAALRGQVTFTTVTSPVFFATGGVAQRFRLVLNPASWSLPAGVPNTTADSGWTFFYNAGLLDESLTFLAVASCGPGTYSVQLQTQGFVWPATTPTPNAFQWGRVQVTVHEAIPAG